MNYQEFIKKAAALRKVVDKLYIYGAGMFGRDISGILIRNGVKIDGFVESVCEARREVWGLPVDALDNVLMTNCGIIIGMNVDNTKDALLNLEKRNFPDSKIINGGYYYAEDKISHILQDNPLLEITPVIGCRVNCKYCPQHLLIKKYFEKDKNRQKVMTISDFQKILENTPDNCTINFAGLTEPFLHPECIKMLELACHTGRAVLLFSTFVGASDEDVERVLKMPIQAVTVHCADKMGYSNITADKHYYDRMRKILAARKSDGESWVTGMIAQTEPTEEMLNLCKGLHEIKYSLHDRAGVYDDKNLSRLKKPHTGKFECSLGGPQCNSHVVLPDGTVILCNQDFRMEHVLGNIYESSFDELQNGAVMQKVFKGMAGDSSIPLVCRHCVCTHSLESL